MILRERATQIVLLALISLLALLPGSGFSIDNIKLS